MKNNLKVAIYDTPRIVSKSLAAALRSSGCQVIFDGPLNQNTAKTEADIWITKWSFGLNREFLSSSSPRLGLVTLSVGVEHIDRDTLLTKGVIVKNCPTYGSGSVAEHAVALSMRAKYGADVLPPLNEGSVAMIGLDPIDTEATVAQILLRSRQIETSVQRAAKYDYSRTDGAWHNKELNDITVGILDERFANLAKVLRKGFGTAVLCQNHVTSIKEAGARGIDLAKILDSDYIIIPEQSATLSNNWGVSKVELPDSQKPYAEQKVAVLGGGRIGSRIAKIFRDGFGSEVSVYCRIQREELSRKGIKVTNSISEALEGASLVVIALPLNEGTRATLNRENILRMSPLGGRIIVNVGRSEVVHEEQLITLIDEGHVQAYATDVVPKEGAIWLRNEPSDLTRRFVENGNVIVTPHEGDCSSGSIQRMNREVREMIKQIVDEVT
ncbi:MAG: NAD(P)-dependent oxidoreductase [Candidatus Bilamarchaeum sp.]